MFELPAFEQLKQTAWGRFLVDLVAIEALAQLAVVLAAFAVARLAAPWLRRRLGAWRKRLARNAGGRRVAAALSAAAMPLLWLLPLWPASWIAEEAGWPHRLIAAAASLLSAWLVIRMLAAVVVKPVWARAAAVAVWTVAALDITNLLQPTLALLDGVALHMGETRISLLLLVKGVLWLVVLIWLALAAARLAERRLMSVAGLSPSVQVLLGKLARALLLTVAVLATLNAVGIDLTAFAVFGGAIGLGLGFGLQKVVSNLVSGIILLLDKSVKPGDVVAISGTYGWINALSARYVSVITRDGIEHLIPNEELITNRVENWSYSHKLVRLKIPIGIAYGCDPHQAIALCVDAAASVKRVLPQPEPRCLLRGFGDSSLDLELRVWIDDPTKGVANVTSDILLAIWDVFQAHGIAIPFPQRDVHIRSMPSRRPAGGDDGGVGNGGEEGY